MKKILRVLSVIVAPFMFVCSFLTGCKSCNRKSVSALTGTGIMQDTEEAPTQAAAYEKYTRQAYEDYMAVAGKHMVDGEVDFGNPEVNRAACSATSKMFAYACYNERTLDKYVYFSDQEGETSLSSGSGKARRQEYYLRVNEGADTCGYRFHYTIKYVEESSGTFDMFKSQFESARIRMTDKTNLLYRFEGDKIRFGETHEKLQLPMLECDWKTGDDWGKSDLQIVKSEFIEPENIRRDIEAHAGEDNITIRGNINILADDIVKTASLSITDEGCYFMLMIIDTDAANKDEASLKMLRKANGSKDCRWIEKDDTPGLVIICQLWENGLFKTFSISERWQGNIVIFNGAADSVTSNYYSYSDRDCDMTDNLKMLEDAKAVKAA